MNSVAWGFNFWGYHRSLWRLNSYWGRKIIRNSRLTQYGCSSKCRTYTRRRYQYKFKLCDSFLRSIVTILLRSQSDWLGFLNFMKFLAGASCEMSAIKVPDGNVRQAMLSSKDFKIIGELFTMECSCSQLCCHHSILILFCFYTGFKSWEEAMQGVILSVMIITCRVP